MLYSGTAKRQQVRCSGLVKRSELMFAFSFAISEGKIFEFLSVNLGQ